MTTNRKHTHTAHCQLCDREQAANVKSANLAKHGYTKRWGFFSGTCPGSGHQPYEYSADLIPARLVAADESIYAFKQAILEERRIAKANPTRGYLRIVTGFSGRGGYDRVATTVVGTFHGEPRDSTDPYSRDVVSFRLDEPQTIRNRKGDEITLSVVDSGTLYREHGFYSVHTAADYAAQTVAAKVDGFKREIKQIETYREWLDARLSSWKRDELTPVVIKVEAAVGTKLVYGDRTLTITGLEYRSRGFRSTASWTLADEQGKPAGRLSKATVTKLLNAPA